MKVPIKTFCKGLLLKASNNSSAWLTGFAAVGVIATTVETARVATKASRFIKDKNDAMENLKADLEKGVVTDEEFKQHKKGIYISFAKDMAKTCWPVVLTGGLTIASMFAAHKIDARKQAELAAALAFKDDILDRYREEVSSEIGTDDETVVRHNTAVNKGNETLANLDKSDILVTGHGNKLCYDVYGNRFFYCSVAFIREKVAELNEELVSSCPCPTYLNELYSKLDLPSTKVGKILGWKIGNRELHWSNEFIRLSRDTGINDNDDVYYILDFEDEIHEV